MTFRLLHTSDWHLGRRLYGRSRHREQTAFLDWLAATLDAERIDLLIVSGDIFDASTPSHRCQSRYYRFLHRAAGTACRHIVVIGGNHDAPALLEAPKALLSQLNVHVVGRAAKEIEQEVLTLRDAAGAPQAIVCAVPYLRDREVRASSAGESVADKQRRLLAGIKHHYKRVLNAARGRRDRLGGRIPLIATGHLFAAGGKTETDDGVRELYVGALVRLDAGLFGDDLDYLALGHLHRSQRVAGAEHLRYSGAPLAVSFADAGRSKAVLICEWGPSGRRIRELTVPCFQNLDRIEGDLSAIERRLQRRIDEGRPLWVEVHYTGREMRSDLGDILHRLTAGSSVEILRIRNRRQRSQLMRRADRVEELDELTPSEVFARCLAANHVEADVRPALTTLFEEVLQELYESGAASGRRSP
ncbi:MAG: exonuclease SbcCD subunit D C-terminal domain-containing protein [Desulfosarcinaceae bacterium]|nr:exonuclease SbcCD subunit D C-terminal domain-containing protein [Desulfosarcinaceae bacterium]